MSVMGEVSSKRATDEELLLREEAFRMLEGRGLILETARDLSRLFREHGISAVIIGGVAVALHGHIRTTVDVNVLTYPPPESRAKVLTDAGYEFDAEKREFRRWGVPVHEVLPERAVPVPAEPGEIDGVTTVSLPRLINMKLRTGSTNLLRAQDMADVIGLMRHHALGNDFARHIDRDLRSEYQRLARAIQQERKNAEG